MSYYLNVYLKRQNMPDPAAWRAAILAAGFPVQLDSEFDVDTFTGFLPCMVEGELAGFEYHAQAGADEPGCDFTITLMAGFMPQEIVAALAAAGTLASLSGGTLYDSESGESYGAGEALAWAKAETGRI